jgi:hypothetical protein
MLRPYKVLAFLHYCLVPVAYRLFLQFPMQKIRFGDVREERI